MEDIIISLLIISFIGLIDYALYKWVKFKEKEYELEELKLTFQFQYDQSKQDSSKFLNDFIEDCLKDYVMNNIVPDTGLTYIQKDRENQIRKELTDMVSRRMSPLVRKKILMSYSEDYLAEAIAEKIFYVVSIYVADFNMEKPRQGQDIKPKKIKIQESDISEESSDW